MNKIFKKILREILVLVTNLSDKNLIRIIDLIKDNFLKDKKFIEGAIRMKNEISHNFSSSKYLLLKRVFKSLSKNSQRKIIENFLFNECIFGRYKRKELKKKINLDPPWTMVISPTARCNLNCAGCYAGLYSKKEDLPFEEVDRILKEAKDLAIYFVTISGGEPFIYDGILDIFKKHGDVYFLVYTNGTLIDEELAKKLAKLGNVMLGISVEGFEKETDSRRGKGIFKKIIKAMECLKKEGVLFGFSTTVTKKNFNIVSSEEFVDFYISKGCNFGWYFLYVPIGRNPDVSLMVTPSQRNTLRIKINEFRSKKPIFIGDFWNDGPFVGGCIAGARSGGYFHINCYGDVEPCVFLQFSVDNIKGKKLIEVIQSPFFKAIREAQPYCQNKNLLTPCLLIDHPWLLRDLVKKYKAKPSYPNGLKLIVDSEITRFLDNFAKEYKKITDPIWEKEFFGFCHWKDKKDL
jgi:MoaA/NifB/PqqE/SkfB family radical SAM enzyme